MNADIAFHKVEARAVEEAADGVRADIQAVNLVAIIGQQAFGQVVTDKAVHTQNQHAGAALHRHKRTAGEQRARHQTQRRRQLSALHINAVSALTGNDFQRAFTAGNHQRREGQNGTRLRGFHVSTHTRFPDDKFVGANIAKRARPRIAHRTHQVMQRLSRFFPLQAAIFRGTTTDVGRLRMILHTLVSLAAANFRQRIAKQRLGGRAQLTVQRQRYVRVSYRYALLGHNIARVRAVGHTVQRHAGLFLTVHQHPVQRRATPVFRQQRAVQVERPFRRQIEDLVAEQVAVIEGENHFRRHRADALHPQRVVDVFRRVNGNTLLSRQAGNGAEEVILTRVVRVSEDRLDVVSGIQQCLNTGATHVVIGKYNSFH